MKRIFSVIIVSFLVFFSYAQNNSLFDVNYDKPKHTLSYDESLQSFQNIYLQYETTIRNSELDIHDAEQTIRLNEKKADREQFNKELSEALKKQKEEIYATEIENLRTQERDKLANELREEISTQLNVQFTTEFEKKKNEEIKRLEKELRDQISLENDSLKKQYKTEVRNELESEYTKKKNEEVKIFEADLRKTISLENENLKKQYKAEVRNELESEYVNKKEEEVKYSETELRKTISLENENLRERYKTEVRNELESEYANKKDEEVSAIEANLRENVSLENERLKQQYKSDVRNELEAEYEDKKNKELKVIQKQLHKEILEETQAVTNRIKIVMPYIAAIIILICMYFAGRLLLKLKKQRSIKKSEKKNYEALVDFYADGYFNEFKQYDGKTTVLAASKKIREDIDSVKKSEEKQVRMKAIKKAEEMYKQYKSTLPIGEYKKAFDDLDAKKIFNRWNSNKDDNEIKKGLCNEFFSIVNDYNKLATEAYTSNNDKNDIAEMFKIYVPIMDNTAEQVKDLAQSESNKEIRNNLISISEKYVELAKKFTKGEF